MKKNTKVIAQSRRSSRLKVKAEPTVLEEDDDKSLVKTEPSHNVPRPQPPAVTDELPHALAKLQVCGLLVALWCAKYWYYDLLSFLSRALKFIKDNSDRIHS